MKSSLFLSSGSWFQHKVWRTINSCNIFKWRSWTSFSLQILPKSFTNYSFSLFWKHIFTSTNLTLSSTHTQCCATLLWNLWAPSHAIDWVHTVIATKSTFKWLNFFVIKWIDEALGEADRIHGLRGFNPWTVQRGILHLHQISCQLHILLSMLVVMRCHSQTLHITTCSDNFFACHRSEIRF